MTTTLDEKSRLEPTLTTTSPTRIRRTNSRNSTSKSPTKKFKGQFTLYPADKFFKYSQVKIGESSVFSEDPTLMELSRQLQCTLEEFDDKLLRLMQKHESNFLAAYKGVMRDVAHDLKHYQEELDKNAQGYRETENYHLKNQMTILKEEVNMVVTMSRSYEADNKKLRNIIIKLKDELRSQNEVLMRSDDQVSLLQQKCHSLKERLQQKENEAKELTLANEHLKPISTIDAQLTDQSLNMALQIPLNNENQTNTGHTAQESNKAQKIQFKKRLHLPEKETNDDIQKNNLKNDKGSKSPTNHRSPLNSSITQKAEELKPLADTITDILRKKFIEEEEIKTMTDQIVNWADMFIRQKTREVKVLRESVSRLQKGIELNERMEVQSTGILNRAQRNENRVLKEIFRQCVEESLNDLLVNRNILATSREFLDSEKRNELQKRVQLFEKYLRNPQVMMYLENIIADRPPDYQNTQGISDFQANLRTINKEKTLLELPSQAKSLEGVKYSIKKILESTTPEPKSTSNSSNLLSNKETLGFTQPALTHRETNEDESLSDLLSERGHRVGKNDRQWPIVTTQDARGIMLQSAGSRMHVKKARAGSSGAGGKLRRGRPQQLDNQDNGILKTENNLTEHLDPRFLTLNDETPRMDKSPLTRRALVKNEDSGIILQNYMNSIGTVTK